MVVEQDQPLSKTSVLARFRHWMGGGAGKEPTTLENERNCSFSKVGVHLSLCRRCVPCISQMGG